MTPSADTRFQPPISTSNLVAPDRDVLMNYARAAYDGAPVVTWLETRLAAVHGTAHCVTLCSGFWALVLAIRELVLPGRTDILMPSLTYRRMADVAAWCRLRPRFCEVDPATLACSPATMRASLASAVGLLLAVHPIVGQCDVEGLETFAADEGLPLLFDSVESASERTGRGMIGAFGSAECFSLHASKLVNGLEGGYLTTNDGNLARRLVDARNGNGPTGLDARLNQIHAAMALAGLDGLEAQIARNRERFTTYERLLQHVSGLRLLPFSDDSSFKTIVVELLDSWTLSRAETLARLNDAGVLARAYYYPPLHAKPMVFPHVTADLPVTETLAERYMLLPCGHHVDSDAIAGVVDMLREIAP